MGQGGKGLQRYTWEGVQCGVAGVGRYGNTGNGMGRQAQPTRRPGECVVVVLPQNQAGRKHGKGIVKEGVGQVCGSVAVGR